MALTKIFAVMFLLRAGASAAACEADADETSLIQVKKDMKLGSEETESVAAATNVDATEQKAEQPLIGAPAPVTRDAAWVKTYLGVDLDAAGKKAKSTDYLSYGVGLPPPVGNSALKSLNVRVLCKVPAFATGTSAAYTWTSFMAGQISGTAAHATANPCGKSFSETASATGAKVEEGTTCIVYPATTNPGVDALGNGYDQTNNPAQWYCTSPGLCQADGSFANPAPTCVASLNAGTCAAIVPGSCNGCVYSTTLATGAATSAWSSGVVNPGTAIEIQSVPANCVCQQPGVCTGRTSTTSMAVASGGAGAWSGATGTLCTGDGCSR